MFKSLCKSPAKALLPLVLPAAIIPAVLFWGLNIYALLAVLPLSLLLLSCVARIQAQRHSFTASRDLLRVLREFNAALYLGTGIDKAMDNALKQTDHAGKTTQHAHTSRKTVSCPRSLKDMACELSQLYPLLEARAIGRSLMAAQSLGDRLPDLLRRIETTLADRLRLDNELRANQSREINESLLLCLMPFVIAPMFLSLQSAESNTSSIALLLRLLAFLLALLAFGMQIRFLYPANDKGDVPSPGKNDPFSRFEQSQSGKNFLHRISGMRLICLIVDRLPATIHTRLKKQEAFADIHKLIQPSNGEDDLCSNHCVQSLSLLFFAFPLCLSVSLLFSLYSGQGFYLFFPLLYLPFSLPFLKRIEQSHRNAFALRRDLPLYCQILCAFLHNGLPLRSAMQICNHSLQNGTPLAEFMSTLYRSGEQQRDMTLALEQAARHFDLDAFGACFLLLARYDSMGHRSLLESIGEQCRQSWLESQDRQKSEFARRASLRLFPMMLDLVSVMLIGLTPAITVFIGI